MKFKNPNKNNELKALVETLKEKGLITDDDIKKKVKHNGRHNNRMLYDKIERVENRLEIMSTLKWICGFSLSFSILNLGLMINHIGAA